MRFFLALCCLAVVAQSAGAEPVKPSPKLKLAMTCFKTDEQISGMNKICFYDCLGSQAAITISSVGLCPLTIDR